MRGESTASIPTVTAAAAPTILMRTLMLLIQYKGFPIQHTLTRTCGAVENMMGLCICVKAHSKYATKAWQ